MLQMMSIEYTVPSVMVGVPLILFPIDFKFIFASISIWVVFHFAIPIEWQNIFFRCKGTAKNANHQKFSGKDMNHIEKSAEYLEVS